MPSDPPNLPKAEYDAAVAAFESHETVMELSTQRYKKLLKQYHQMQARYSKLVNKMTLHRSAYQRHKQYVLSLRNAKRHSYTALLTAAASDAMTHAQILTFATLTYELKIASNILFGMLVKNKRFHKVVDKGCEEEQKFYIKVQNMFRMLHRDLSESDRLHADVLEAGAKIGKDTECGREEGRCDACKRNEEREAMRLAAEEEEAKRVAAEKEEAERAIVEGRGRIRGGMSKAALGKQMLDAILEEDESQDGANA